MAESNYLLALVKFNSLEKQLKMYGIPVAKLSSTYLISSIPIVSTENGVITEINPIISKSPEAINDQPYENWICRISSQDDINNKELFLDASRYNELTR